MASNYYFEKSGTSYIDALLGGAKWGSPQGESAALTYSINSPASRDTYRDSTSEANSMQAFNAIEEAAIHAVLKEWSNVANITFRHVDEQVPGDIRIAKSAEVTEDGSAGWAYTPGTGSFVPGEQKLTPSSDAGDVWLETGFKERADAGDHFRQLLLHETGHALGLKHSFEGDDVLGDQDNGQYTVMSYTAHPHRAYIKGIEENSWWGLSASTPMLYDIAAIQYLYGANYSYNSGDTVYSFSDTPVLMALWDGGGTDRLDFSDVSFNVDISLAEGSFSSFGKTLGSRGESVGIVDNFAIAYDAKIENLTGSSQADILSGNGLDNRINGGGGSDVIDGVSGNDVLEVDATFDELIISVANAQRATLKIANDTITLKNIDAISVDGGYIDLKNINQSQLRVASEVNVMEVARLYQAALDRTPDAAGLNYWIDEYERGFTLQDISQGFVDAQEFSTRFNVATGRDFITTLYENVLNRAPDQTGLEYWLTDIDNGQRYQDILVSFSESEENKGNTINLDNSLNYEIDAGQWLN